MTPEFQGKPHGITEDPIEAFSWVSSDTIRVKVRSNFKATDW